MILTRNDVAAVAACVQALNDGGVHDPLLDKLRALFVTVPPNGMPLIKVSARVGGGKGDEEHPKERTRASSDVAPPVSPPAGADYPDVRELEYEPGAPDTVIADETAVESLARPDARPSTVAAVRAGVENAEREKLVEEPLSFRRRRRRTRAVNE